MITDAEIRLKGVAALSKSLGTVEAERFIALIQREPFDYTKWSKDLFEGRSVEELSALASEHRCREKPAGEKSL
jgi:hypothetical protein